MPNDKSLTVFDTETSGIDVENDRIVTAFIGQMDRDGEWIRYREWLIDPGIEIPTEASDIHGVTTEYAREHGISPEQGVAEIDQTLSQWVSENSPLSVYNSPYDLTLLDRELGRHLGLELNPKIYETVVDPLVIDKAIDKYRKGSRKLVAVAEHYGVPVEENAHNAGADCLMTGRIAWKLLSKTKLHPGQLHEKSVGWKAEQAASLQEYLRRTEPDTVVDGEWPMKRR